MLLDHLPDEVRAAFPNGVTGNLIGFLENAYWDKDHQSYDQAKQGVEGAIRANFVVVDDRMRGLFKNLYEIGRLDKIGFSIDVEGTISMGPEISGMPIMNVDSIDKAYALDAVTYPAAGGRFDRMVASEKLKEGRKNMNREAILQFLRAFSPSLLEGKDLAKIVESDLNKMVAQAAKGLAAKIKAKPLGEDAVTEALQTALSEASEAFEKDEADKAGKSLQAALVSLGANASIYRESSDGEGEEEPAPAPAEPAPAAEPAEEPAPAAPAASPATTPAQESQRAAEAAERKKAKDRLDKLEAEVKQSRGRESQAVLRAKLSDSGLPMPMRESIAKELKDKVLTEADIDKRVDRDRELLAKLSDSGDIRGMGTIAGGRDSLNIGLTESDRVQRAFDLLVDPELARLEESKDTYKGIKPFMGLREAYVYMSGDSNVRFQRRTLESSQRMSEAAVSDFPKIFGDSVTRHLLRTYRMYPPIWREAVSIKPLDSFRTQRPIQWGLFNDLAVVAEEGSYTAFTNPTEREETYAPDKRGRSFVITREMILGDDLRKLREIGPGIARAANRTLRKFVFNLMIGNEGGGGVNTDTMADGNVIYTNARGNLKTEELDHDELRDGIEKMMLMKDESTAEVLGIAPKYLWVPIQLRSTAMVLVQSEKKPGSANNDVNENKGAVEVMAVPELTDAKDWFLQAAQADVESIELGFVEGEEDPVILIQDDPRVGNVFTNDKITYKVRHEYGGVPTNHRGLVGSVVA